ncbi:MAG: Hpt domain-containing protein [Desulfopila sp.]|jgi:HPt (histidine-containing phosphotransfer) domain-containing protein|nr:Hpt domain-containing protein [Desulfopila sp.]
MDRLKWDKAFALEQAADDTELLEELLTIFKQSCTSDYHSIKEGLTSGDAEKICAAAHSIKGAAASLGIVAIRDLAAEIETDSRKGSTVSAQERIEELSQYMQLLQKM